MNQPPLFAVALAALSTAFLLGVAASDLSEGSPPATSAVLYGRDIRPLLSDRCFRCHGPDISTREADLRLDTYELATADRGGYAAVTPGDLETSELWYRISSADPDEQMPPPASHKRRFSEAERDLVRSWIEGGAAYEEHWAFVPPTRAPETDLGGLSLIDAHVGQKLAANGLEPSPEARPDLLLRRLFLDLTGLPPTPEELDAFLAEYDPTDRVEADATWSRWVARLFAEEPYASRYAERMATPWMDQARYADTSGIHMDAGRQIWPWRDWVLAAYRDNKPFDQFLIEQVAGDLLPDASVDQIVASGFNRNHVITDEGGAIDEEYLVEYSVDRVATTGEVFLGLTMGCARCHDHKFDPVTQEDFYRFYAFFNSIEEPGLYSQLPDPKRAFEPFLEVPSAEQLVRRAGLAKELEATRATLTEATPEDLVALEDFRQALPGQLGLEWVEATVVATESEGGATFTVLDDGSVLAGGQNPERDTHRFTLRTDARDLRLLQLDVLGHESFVNGAPGRADNGNAVLTSISVEAVSVLDPTQRRAIPLDWSWADFAQANDDYGIQRAFDARANTGWAIAGHTDGSERSALFLADDAFGYEGGTDVVVTLGYDSIWAAHVFGHVRIGLAQLGDEGIARLPLSQGRWYQAGPFNLESATGAYQAEFGPATDTTLDPMRDFPPPSGPAVRWAYRQAFTDGVVTELAGGVNVHYVGKEIWSPTARELEVSLGSDDGFAVFVNGNEIAAREVPRGVAADQDRVTIPLQAGRNSFVLEVTNTGGQAGFYFRALESEQALGGDLVAAVVDPTWRKAPEPGAMATLDERLLHTWRLSRSPDYAANLAREAELLAQQAQLEAEVPRTMVMRERAMPRPAFVLNRGEYDKADPERPVAPGVPGFLERFGKPLPSGEERATRLDLAYWLTEPDNPLVSRVAVNRAWQMIFGRGLVSTSENFGYQGAWPSHPELLDELALDFIASGWDQRALITRIVTSATYRQSSTQRPEVLAIDPDDALLATYPRRRLDAEAIRDQALYVSGHVAEELGGPSVKPYQPPGLWQEIAMLGSNTRIFERGTGDELWRRSLYTYWKRAAPPPAMLTFDAPTREACEIQRATTNTPLQALALWNDEQFVEASRKLAERTLAESESDTAALVRMYRRCTGRAPDATEVAILSAALDDHRARYADSDEDARALLAIGEAMSSEEVAEASELAAWTLIASAILNLHATITQG